MGPLVNLSEGGLLIRVDRILNLGNGMRVPPTTVFFDRGKDFPLLRIRELPKFPLLTARGTVAHAEERNGEIQVGIQFSDLQQEEAAQLHQVLELREKLFRTTGGQHGSTEPSPEKVRDGTQQPSLERL